MAVKYFVKYFDVIDVEHIFNIYDDTYVGEAIQIDGNVTITNAETDDVLEAIRGRGLSVSLEASESLTFADLWSEEEKTFKVDYKRDGVLLFDGWLNPEGFFENYVNTNWIVSFDCVDGLGYLSDLSFVYENGLPITGRKKYIELLSLALIRTGQYLKINTSIGIVYSGLSESLDILNNVYANTERYVKDDGETIMSCEEVLRDILEPFGACLTYHKGEWYIYKPNELYNSPIVTFFKYTYLGVIDPITPSEVIDFGATIGSNWNGATIHHCSGNQTMRNTSSVGAYRVNYKYGLVQKLLKNYDFYTANGITFDDWNIINSSTMDPLVAGNYGIVFSNNSGSAFECIRTKDILISGSKSIDVLINYERKLAISFIRPDFTYQIIISNKIYSDATGSKYYLQDNYEWGAAGASNTITGEQLFDVNSIEIKTPPQPVAITGDAYFYVSIWSPTGSLSQFETLLNYVKISPSSTLSGGNNSSIKGEFHTFQRTTKPSSKIKSTKEVATGDNDSNFYEGTIYENDTTTPTISWNRKGVVESKPILQIMGEETLRLSQLPSRVFAGDVFGFYNYLSVITINGLSGLFMPIKYNYNTKANIITAELKQIYGNELTDIDYKLTLDYGDTVKPTIKG